MDYYKLPFVSNSELTELHNEMYGISKPENIAYIFGMGNLVDAMITEQHKVDYQNLTVKGVEDVAFTLNDFERAEKMKEVFWSDPALSDLFPQMRYQYVYVRNSFEINHDGFVFTLPVKIKLDGIIRNVLGADIKTTSATSYRAFIAALKNFHVDRQVAWYMDIAKLDKFILIGVSKKLNKYKKPELFKFAVQRGDEFYNSGKDKYQYLAFMYNTLVHQIFKK